MRELTRDVTMAVVEKKPNSAAESEIREECRVGVRSRCVKKKRNHGAYFQNPLPHATRNPLSSPFRGLGVNAFLQQHRQHRQQQP